MNFKKAAAITLALSFSFGASNLVNPTVASASSVIELGVDSGRVAYQEKLVNLEQNQALRDEALREIKAIRAKMWDENVIYTNDENSNPNKERLQDVAKSAGYKTKEEYVNSINWSTELEKIAIQRAFEQTVAYSHDRPDGSSFFDIKSSNGVIPYGENLARITDRQSPKTAIYQWTFDKDRAGYSEYDYLIKANGVCDDDNGHLHLILDPEYDSFGLAVLNGVDPKWNIAVSNFGYDTSSSKATNLVGQYLLYVGNPAGKKSTTITNSSSQTITDDERQSLEETVANAQDTIDAAEYIMENYPNTVKNVLGPLKTLIESQKTLISRANTMLGK